MGEQFEGTIGRTYDDSTPWWPPLATAPDGAPNVVLVLLDDVGYAQFGCYGSDIATPTFDRLAANGRRYANFHTTALCSPTRACLLTGRNHHSNGMARVVELAAGFPGYNSTIPKENGFLSEILVRNGYATYAVGKWHLTPATEMTPGSPKDRWPLGRGFERYYGFMGGETDQYRPDLVYDNHPIEPPRTPEDGYHLTEDLADRAQLFLKDLRATSPDQAVLPLVHARARATRRIRRPPTTSTGTAATSIRVGTSGAKRCSSARSRRVCCPPTPSCPNDRRGCRRGTRCRVTSNGCPPA